MAMSMPPPDPQRDRIVRGPPPRGVGWIGFAGLVVGVGGPVGVQFLGWSKWATVPVGVVLLLLGVFLLLTYTVLSQGRPLNAPEAPRPNSDEVLSAPVLIVIVAGFILELGGPLTLMGLGWPQTGWLRILLIISIAVVGVAMSWGTLGILAYTNPVGEPARHNRDIARNYPTPRAARPPTVDAPPARQRPDLHHRNRPVPGEGTERGDSRAPDVSRHEPRSAPEASDPAAPANADTDDDPPVTLDQIEATVERTMTRQRRFDTRLQWAFLALATAASALVSIAIEVFKAVR